MAYNISLPYRTRKHKVSMQLAMLHAVLSHRITAEMKVLSFMVRHAAGGVYVIRKNMRKDIAKAVGSTHYGVKEVMYNLRNKGLIRYVRPQDGTMGCYTFHKAISGLCENQEIVTFKFIRKLPASKIPSS